MWKPPPKIVISNHIIGLGNKIFALELSGIIFYIDDILYIQSGAESLMDWKVHGLKVNIIIYCSLLMNIGSVQFNNWNTEGKSIGNYLCLYKYIYSYPQKDVLFYQNSSVWLDRLDSRTWDRNPANWNVQPTFYHSATRKPAQAKEI